MKLRERLQVAIRAWCDRPPFDPTSMTELQLAENLDSLLAEVEALEDQVTWQPIEKYHFPDRVLFWSEWSKSMHVGVIDITPESAVTHWMPSPEPPKGEPK